MSWARGKWQVDEMKAFEMGLGMVDG